MRADDIRPYNGGVRIRADVGIRPYGVGLGLCVICHLRRQCFQRPHNILDSLRWGRCPHRPVFKTYQQMNMIGHYTIVVHANRLIMMRVLQYALFRDFTDRR